eukprot:scaffold381_cov138-Cylindrotheca_fusiformis.AAC.15
MDNATGRLFESDDEKSPCFNQNKVNAMGSFAAVSDSALKYKDMSLNQSCENISHVSNPS